MAALSRRRIAVIGDSIFLGIREHDTDTALTGAPPTTDWTIDAESGFGRGASSPHWPLSVVVGSWPIHQSAT